jgi:hypothetical protein
MQPRFVSRFRLALLGGVAFLAFAPLSGCTGYGMSEYEKLQLEREGFARMIADAGGSAVKQTHNMHGLKAEGWMIDLSKVEITDKIIQEVTRNGQDKPVLKLVLAGSTITDAQLKQLDDGKVLQKTVVLDLSDTAITDAGLDQLKEHYIVQVLNLKGSKASAEAGKRLGERQIANPQTPKSFKKIPEITI